MDNRRAEWVEGKGARLCELTHSLAQADAGLSLTDASAFRASSSIMRHLLEALKQQLCECTSLRSKGTCR